MLMFLASVLEQMDVALEHISKRGVHDARFGIMLTDNAVELVLHQIAKDAEIRLKWLPLVEEDYPHKAELADALGRTFEEKLRFAKAVGKLEQEASGTFSTMHSYRNELYHVGVRHEEILPDLALFHFETACRFLAEYRPFGLGWASNMKLPERSKKYFSGDRLLAGSREDFASACRDMEQRCGHNKANTIRRLADHMEHVIGECSRDIEIVAEGVYEEQQTNRDQAVIDCQAWQLALSEEGLTLARKNGWDIRRLFPFVEWLGKNHHFRVKRDPVPSWRKQAKRLRSYGNPHLALSYYQSFMASTSGLRQVISDHAAAAEAEIQRMTDEQRGK